MKRKKWIATWEVYKWKACLNIHSEKKQYGANYWETYAPVVTCTVIQLILILPIMMEWHTKETNFVLGYPEALVKCKLFMKIPKGFEVNSDPSSHALQIISNLYGQKQACRL